MRTLKQQIVLVCALIASSVSVQAIPGDALPEPKIKRGLMNFPVDTYQGGHLQDGLAQGTGHVVAYAWRK